MTESEALRVRFYSAMPVGLKRAQEKPSLMDGVRVLVDAAWPAGIPKKKLRVDHWMRELGASEALRKWFRGRSDAFAALRKRYLKELEEPEALKAFEQLHRLAQESKQLTLVYSAREGEAHPAQVLRDLLEGMRKPPTSSGPARAAAASGRVRASRRR